MPPGGAIPPVHLCHGKPCRTGKGFRKMLALLDDLDAHRIPVRCQGICKGPVVGLTVEGELRWYRKLCGAKKRRALREALQTGRIRGKLKRCEVKKKRGKLKGKRLA